MNSKSRVGDAPLTSHRLFPGIPYAAERKFAAAVTKSSVSSSSLSNEIVSSPARTRAASRSVLATKSSRLSCKLSARWSFSPAPPPVAAAGDEPFSCFSVAALPVTIPPSAPPFPLACTTPFG